MKAILDDYIRRDASTFDFAWHGFRLNTDEQRRRFVIKSILQCDGLSRADYCRYFRTDVLDDFPELTQLVESGLAKIDSQRFKLTNPGIELSDAIAPWFYSETINKLMKAYNLR